MLTSSRGRRIEADRLSEGLPGEWLYTRILCALNGSPASLAALDAARRLLAPSGEMLVVAALDGWNPVSDDAADAVAPAAHAARVVARACERAGAGARPHGTVCRGPAGRVVRRLAELSSASLVAFGTCTERPRWTSSSVATELVRTLGCSALVTPSGVPSSWPARTLVGVDGSEATHDAAAVAVALAERFGVPALAVATPNAHHAAAELGTAPPTTLEVHVDERALGAALRAAAEPDDLLVVARHGHTSLLHAANLGEQLAMRAPCPVIVYCGPGESTAL